MTCHSKPRRSRPARLAIVALAVLLGGQTARAEQTSPTTPIPTMSVAADRHQDTPDSFRRIVGYADLDLTTEAGSRALRDRVRAAAHDGCKRLHRTAPAPRSLQQREACIRASVAKAAPQVEDAVRVASTGIDPSRQLASSGDR